MSGGVQVMLDVDGDGQVSYDEFLSVVKEGMEVGCACMYSRLQRAPCKHRAVIRTGSHGIIPKRWLSLFQQQGVAALDHTMGPAPAVAMYLLAVQMHTLLPNASATCLFVGQLVPAWEEPGKAARFYDHGRKCRPLQHAHHFMPP
eukprot:scaffold42541_cov20-Tisochrysis_lutea.AAC.1